MSRRHANESSEPTSRLYVGQLPYAATGEHLRAHFERYGLVEDAVVIADGDGRSRGFGFVSFAAIETSMAAFAEQQEIDGRAVCHKRGIFCVSRLPLLAKFLWSYPPVPWCVFFPVCCALRS